ncbi:hypothetical protein A2U01_0095393, partial [Trifolium medium]|nr:hypothetical protein [Trifolium medium]
EDSGGGVLMVVEVVD